MEGHTHNERKGKGISIIPLMDGKYNAEYPVIVFNSESM
jgi:hypothetical protein